MATSTGTIQSLPPPPPPPPTKHRSIHTLQDIMSADETITGRPPRVPRHRLPGGRKPRHVLAAIENASIEELADEERSVGKRRKGRRKSEFDVWKDGIRDRRDESSFATATAVVDASPASLRNASPKDYRHRNDGGTGRTGRVEALEEEYLNGGRRKVASPIAEETEDEDEGRDVEEEVTATRVPHLRKHSISNLLLAHSNPKLEHTPFPTPPLSRLHRKFSSVNSSPPTAEAAQLPSNPVLPVFLPDKDPSLLQQMRAFRAHFESRPLVPPRRRPAPPPPPLLSSPPAPHTRPRRQPPPRSSPEPRQRAPHRSPPLSPHNRHTTPSSSIASKYAFTLPHLPALTHHSRTAIVTLTPTTRSSTGALTLQLRNLAERKGGGTHTYHIPIHGLPITITENTTGATTTYAIEDLPLKHLPAVRYARHFVDVVKRGTVVGRVEVREKYSAGEVWVGRRWGDGRFEVLREGTAANDPVRVELSGDDGKRVRVWKGAREIDIGEGRYRKIVERAKRMYTACAKALEEEDLDTDHDYDHDYDETKPLQKRSQHLASSSSSSPVAAMQRPDVGLDATFRVDAATTFVPSVGWCRRSRDHGWWSMLFLDGVRLEIDPASGDAVWIDKGGTKRVLEKGMEMRRVRERVRRFVDQGL